MAGLGSDGELAYAVNYLGPVNLARAANALNIPFIHISSSATLPCGENLREEDTLPLSPQLSNYAKSKLMAELTLRRMAETWDGARMDGLLLLHSTVDAYGYTGMGDFNVDPAGVLSRRPERELSPFLFTGIQILHPRLFEDAPSGRFNLNLLYDRAMEARRLFGVIHDGEWFHVGTPDGLADAETYMLERYPGVKRR